MTINYTCRVEEVPAKFAGAIHWFWTTRHYYYIYIYIYIHVYVCVFRHVSPWLSACLSLHQDFIQAMLPHHQAFPAIFWDWNWNGTFHDKLLCWQGAVDMCAIVLTSSTDSWPSCTCSLSVLTCLNPAVFCKVLHRRTPTAKLSGLFFRCWWLAERVCRCEARYLLSLCPFLRGYIGNVIEITQLFMQMCPMMLLVPCVFAEWALSRYQHHQNSECRDVLDEGLLLPSIELSRLISPHFHMFKSQTDQLMAGLAWLQGSDLLVFSMFFGHKSGVLVTHPAGCRPPLRYVGSHRACPWVPAVAVASPRAIAPSRAQDPRSFLGQRQANDWCFFYKMP